ncbi:MAG: hypothetical protein A3F46_02155 [Legionellales bacterium RIFCSPHIGHO2_12_FULL_42_9]|nr:MAG: hypothetical protein A3F46_02155 [Legionellales bacterium RIFCSPHIGHO2_12_FULL_42_9]
MQLFIEYIQPVTDWLQANPQWALLITFLISFAESLAVIGSIIPGSVTMTAIGILAGSGIMRVDLTFMAAILGAVVGDGISYLLGYFFSERLVNSWPFRRNPQWLAFGKDYFVRHGGKSVLIGRFLGPLRSIIPVIAGMMHMSHWRFYIANFISAIIWSILYILPGVLLGAASSELPPESAAQLIVVVLCLLIGIWLITLFIKWSLIKLNQFLSSSLDILWKRSSKHPLLTKLFKHITPANEKNHYPTASLCIFLSLMSLLFITLTVLVFTQHDVDSLNYPVHLAIQSFRSETIDSIFICVTQSATVIPLCSILVFTLLLAIYYRQTRLFVYCISLFTSTTVFLLLAHWLIQSARPTGILIIEPSSSFPSTSLTYATVLFASVLLYLNKNSHVQYRSSINTTVILLLLLIGFGQMLLGDYWLTDIVGAYLLGLVICLSHWLLYRRHFTSFSSTTSLIITYLSLALIGSIAACKLNYEASYKRHQRFITQYTFNNQAWWSQKKPLLPIYRRNRFGRPVALFNLQYAGTLDNFAEALIASGWSKQEESFSKSLLKRLSGYPAYRDIPLMTQLYLNRKASLVMHYKLKQHGPVLILRLWRSNYYLQDYQQQIWIGSVHTRVPIRKYSQLTPSAMTPLRYVEKALSTQFSQRSIHLTGSGQKKLVLRVAPTLLLIRETPASDEKVAITTN